MKARDFEALGRRLALAMPSFHAKGPMVFARPIGHVLRGLYFDGSSFSKDAFYLHVFAQPLCVPTSHIHFTFGFRLRRNGRERWSSTEPDLVEGLLDTVASQATPWLQNANTPASVAKVIDEMGSTNLNVSEAAALCHVLAGQQAEASVLIDRVLSQVDFRVPWQVAIGTRLEIIKRRLKENAEDAIDLLLQWEAETANALKLSPEMLDGK